MSAPLLFLMMGCTTIPSRASHLARVLQQVEKQTIKPDLFCVGIPRHSTREKVDYDVGALEKFASGYSKERNGFGVKIVLLDQDYGPLCKLAGMLAVAPENALMITIDDDQIYDKRLVETLLKCHLEQFPDSCVCLCGHSIGRIMPGVHSWGYRRTGYDSPTILSSLQLDHGARVDLVSGWAGVLYSRRMFGAGEGLKLPQDLEFYRKTDAIHRLHRNDDLYISAWLSSRGVPRRVVKYFGEYEQMEAKEIGQINPLCLSGHKSWARGQLEHFFQWWKLIRDLESHGYFGETAYAPPNKSISFLCASVAAAFVTVAVVHLRTK